MAMLEVKDLEVYYGMIQAIKGISFEVNQEKLSLLSVRMVLVRQQLFRPSPVCFRQRRDIFCLKDRILQRYRDIRS